MTEPELRRCAHGISFSEKCVDCEVIWHEELARTCRERVSITKLK